MKPPVSLTQFVIAIVLLVVVAYMLPRNLALLFTGTILLGYLALHPDSVKGFVGWLQSL